MTQLMGPNITGGVARGVQTGNALADFTHKRDMRDMYQQHGAGILAGDQNALAAMAGFDPAGAFNIQSSQAQEDRLERQFQHQIQSYAKSLSKDQAAQEAAKLERGLVDAIAFYQAGDLDRLNAHLSQIPDMPPLSDLSQFPAVAARAKGALDALKSVTELQAGPKPGNDYERYVARETAAGRQAVDEFTYAQKKKGGGLSIEMPDGTIVRQGGPAGLAPMADKPKKDMQRIYDPDTKQFVEKPIVGSDTHVDRAKEDQAMQLARAGYDRKYKFVDGKLGEAIDSVERNGRWVAGWGSYLRGIPESEAMTLDTTLATIKANLGFEELQAMRDASPTGGALGQVSEREIDFLQAMQGNLEQAQGPEQLLKILRQIKDGREAFRKERNAILLSGEENLDAGAFDRTLLEYMTPEERALFE